MTSKSIFCCKWELFSYLASGDSDRRTSCRSGRPISGAKLKAWRHRMFKFTPLLICLCLYQIVNHFACWIMNAFSSEKRRPTSMAFWHQADWHTNLPPFQGARPDHVRVESSSCCFPRALWSFVRPRASWRFDPWHVTRSPPIRKRIWVGRYNNGSYTMATKPIKFLELHNTTTQFLIILDIPQF